MPFEGITNYAIIKPSSWDSVKRIGTHLDTFIFRGQSNVDWPLETSLLRAIEKNHHNHKKPARSRHEQQVIRVFKARAHNYLQSPPVQNEDIEWMSIIQDFGGPTRLLDFTESFYIATFFALEDSDDDCAVWCINTDILYMQASMKNIHDFETFAEQSINKPYDHANFVLHINPPRLNQRLAIQHGTFLFPCNIHSSFEENLAETFEFPFSKLDQTNAVLVDEKTKVTEFRKHCIVKIIIPHKIRIRAIEDLYSMNIDAASLFPDLSGFARSLKFQTRGYDARDQTNTSDAES